MPEDTETRHETTDLIDVSDVAAQFDETSPQGAQNLAAAEPITESSLEPHRVEGTSVANLRERFAAFTVDLIILYIVYWLSMTAYRSIALEEAAGPVPAAGIHGLVFHGLFLFIAFLYFLLFEAVLYATPGKLLSGLSIRRVDGLRPSITSCFVRNLLMPLDLILIPVLIPLAVMELTPNIQRLGDLIARTTVVRSKPMPRREYSLTLDMLPSATARSFAFLIDLILFLVLLVGYALLLTPESPLTSMLLIVFFPVLFVLFFMLPEATIKTSLGKWIFGYTICNEDGSTLETSGAMVRTILRPFDNNPIGYLVMLLSIRRQRPGDAAAGTVLCKVPRRLKGLIGIGIIIAIVSSIFYGGISNRKNFLSSDFQVNFLPAIQIGTQGLAGRRMTKGLLNIQQFQFAADKPDSIRRPAIFQPGEKVYLIFYVNGGAEKNGKVWIQEDLTVRYPDGTTGLKLENIIDFNEELEQPGPVEMTNNIALPADATPGRYTASIVIRDKNSGRKLNEQRFFYVTPKPEESQ